jgi:hypothetical protein
LETFFAIFPMVGRFCSSFSKDWKYVGIIILWLLWLSLFQLFLVLFTSVNCDKVQWQIDEYWVSANHASRTSRGKAREKTPIGPGWVMSVWMDRWGVWRVY